MKKIIIASVLVFLFLSCSTQRISKSRNYSNGIVYVLPAKVQELMEKQDINKPNIYFCLEKIEGSKFRIFLGLYKSTDKWIGNTSRYVSVSDKLYPLTFDLDEYFANTETAEEYLRDQKAGIYKRTQRSIVRENVYHIDFDLKGNIIYEGL